MATKKKTEVKSVKSTDGGKVGAKLREDIRVLGASNSEIRKSVAGLLGSTSRHEDLLATLEREHKTMKAVVKKLQTDPLFTVPQKLEKKMAELETKMLQLTVKVNSISKVKADVKVVAPTQGVMERLEKLSTRVDQLESSVATLELDDGRENSASNVGDVADEEQAERNEQEQDRLEREEAKDDRQTSFPLTSDPFILDSNGEL